jgi:hypothetical protein
MSGNFTQMPTSTLHLWIFYLPQSYDMGQAALLPSEGKRAKNFFALKIRRLRPDANPQTWVPKASTLPLDHRSRSFAVFITSETIRSGSSMNLENMYNANWTKYI